MNKRMQVTYYLHSGFSCAKDEVLLVFDYWLGEHRELADFRRLTLAELKQFQEIYVFISHSHPDHFDPEVLTWLGEVPVTYVIADELPADVPGVRMVCGSEVTLGEHVKVKAFDSTDLGVSFLVDLDGIRIFHAGDLNFWHWRDESTLQEIDEAEAAFRKACEPLVGEPIDLAFFPVDPRQGRGYDAGANYFILTVKPRLLVPMHFWGRREMAAEFARSARCRETEVIALVRPKEQMLLEFDDTGFMSINLLNYPDAREAGVLPASGNDDMLGMEDVFSGTDLPIDIDHNGGG